MVFLFVAVIRTLSSELFDLLGLLEVNVRQCRPSIAVIGSRDSPGSWS
jgi:hypothetical protein